MPDSLRTASVETPASFGVHGPGETIRPAAPEAAMPKMSMQSLRRTSSSWPELLT